MEAFPPCLHFSGKPLDMLRVYRVDCGIENQFWFVYCAFMVLKQTFTPMYVLHYTAGCIGWSTCTILLSANIIEYIQLVSIEWQRSALSKCESNQRWSGRDYFAVDSYCHVHEMHLLSPFAVWNFFGIHRKMTVLLLVPKNGVNKYGWEHITAYFIEQFRFAVPSTHTSGAEPTNV